MYVMTIEPKEYVKCVIPAPNFIWIERRDPGADKINSIYLPKRVSDARKQFLQFGEVIAVSPIESEDEQIEKMKEIIRQHKYVGFESHVPVDCFPIPQYRFPDDVSVVQLFVKEITVIFNDMNRLITVHQKFNSLSEQDSSFAEKKFSFEEVEAYDI